MELCPRALLEYRHKLNNVAICEPACPSRWVLASHQTQDYRESGSSKTSGSSSGAVYTLGSQSSFSSTCSAWSFWNSFPSEAVLQKLLRCSTISPKLGLMGMWPCPTTCGLHSKFEWHPQRHAVWVSNVNFRRWSSISTQIRILASAEIPHNAHAGASSPDLQPPLYHFTRNCKAHLRLARSTVSNIVADSDSLAILYSKTPELFSARVRIQGLPKTANATRLLPRTFGMQALCPRDPGLPKADLRARLRTRDHRWESLRSSSQAPHHIAGQQAAIGTSCFTVQIHRFVVGH